MQYKRYDLSVPTEARAAIAETMRDNKLSQKQMADRLGIHEATVSRIVRGYHFPSPQIISRFVRAFPDHDRIDIQTLRAYVPCPACNYMATLGEITDSKCPRCGGIVDEGRRVLVERIKL